MAVNNFNNLLRQCVEAMYTEKGIRTVEYLAGYRLSEEARDILTELVTLVMATNMTSADTKAFLTGKYRSNRNCMNDNGCAINTQTSRSRVFYDLSRLRAAIGEDALEIIIKRSSMELTQ